MDSYDDGLVCALSGVTPSDEELDSAGLGDDDNDAPVEWIQVTVTRKVVNPLYVELIEAKAGLLNAVLAGFDSDEERAQNRRGMEFQIAAQFAALEQSPDYTPILTESAVCYLAPTTHAEGLLDARNELMKSLGLDGAWLDEASKPEEPTAPEKLGMIEDGEAPTE